MRILYLGDCRRHAGALVGVSLDLVAVGRALIGVRGGLVPVGGGLIGGGGRLIGLLPSSIPTPADTRFLFSPLEQPERRPKSDPTLLGRLPEQTGHRGRQPLSGRGQPILGVRRPARDEPALQDPGGLELLEAVGERRR